MIDPDLIKNLPQREMVRCEISGKLVPIEDCEVVVIRIMKAKDVDIQSYNPFPKREETVLYKEPHREVTEAVPTSPNQLPKKNLIPKGILAVMTPHDIPGAAQETRHA